MGAFESISSPETIAAISTAVATIIGAIAAFIKKLRGKNTKEILETIVSKETEVLANTIKDQAKIIEKAVSKDKTKTAS